MVLTWGRASSNLLTINNVSTSLCMLCLAYYMNIFVSHTHCMKLWELWCGAPADSGTQSWIIPRFQYGSVWIQEASCCGTYVQTCTPITAVCTLIPVVDVLAFSVSCNCKKKLHRMRLYSVERTRSVSRDSEHPVPRTRVPVRKKKRTHVRGF